MTVAIAVIVVRIDIENSDAKIKIDITQTKFIQPLLNLHLLKIPSTVHTVRIVTGNINSLHNNINVTTILANNNSKGLMNKTGTEIRQKQSTRTTAINNVNVRTAENDNNLITSKVQVAPLIGIVHTAETEMFLMID
jgi:hypothetical protein